MTISNGNSWRIWAELQRAPDLNVADCEANETRLAFVGMNETSHGRSPF